MLEVTLCLAFRTLRVNGCSRAHKRRPLTGVAAGSDAVARKCPIIASVSQVLHSTFSGAPLSKDLVWTF